MAKQAEPQQTYRVEEKHRGKWQQLMGDDDEPRIVKTTKRFAEAQNIDSDTMGIRYVEIKEDDSESEALKEESKEKGNEEDSELEALKEEYKEKTGKTAHHKWDADRIKEKLEEL